MDASSNRERLALRGRVEALLRLYRACEMVACDPDFGISEYEAMIRVFFGVEAKAGKRRGEGGTLKYLLGESLKTEMDLLSSCTQV